jgi:hypothetical protein
MSVYCGKCKGTHPSANGVRECYGIGYGGVPNDPPPAPSRVSPASGPRAQVPATPPQVRFIRGLYEERRVPPGGETPREAELLERGFDILGWASDEYDAEHDKFVSKAEASDVITMLKGYPVQESPKTRKGSVAPQGNQDEVPAGRYALQGEDGVVRFYQVDKPTDGRWVGYTFVKILIGSPGDWRKERLNRSLQPAILSAIAADVAGSLRLYGQKTEQCGACNSPLSTTRSRAAGYGQKCADTHGLWYPSEAEARAILNEMAGAGAK